jgi:Mce-associated membrane protein
VNTRKAVWGAWTLVVAAAIFAGWAGVSYARASSSGSRTFGAERDAALAAGEREIADLNTVSATQVPRWEARWLADTTGVEHARVAASDAAAATQIARVKTSSAATVTAAVLTSLDTSSATAEMIAVVRVVQTSDSGSTATITNRYSAVLTLTPEGWKISSLNPV